MSSTVTQYGVTLNVDDVPMNNNMRKKLYYQEYEKTENKLIDSYLSKDMDVIDLGACIGFTSCFANDRLGDDRKHLAVEPNPSVLKALKINRECNDCNFEIIPRAYSPIDSEVDIAPTDRAWSASLYRETYEKVSVDTINLRTLVEKYGLNNPILIVDIEGAEADIIKNELDVLEKNFRLLIIEFHDNKSDLKKEQREKIREARQSLENSAFNLDEHLGNNFVYVNSEES